MKYSLVFLLLMICVFGAKAQTSTWDGDANDGKWETAANWSGDVLPCTTCDVIIADGFVELSSINVTIKSLHIASSGTPTQLNINVGPTLTIANPSTYGLHMKQGTLLKVDGTLFFGPNTNKDHILNDGATILVQGLIQGNTTAGNAYTAENGSKLYIDGVVYFKGFQEGISLTSATDSLIVQKTLHLDLGGNGILSSGVVINNDSIYIQNMTQRGIDSDGFIQNNYNADLYIEDITNEALVLNNQSLTFLNYGDIIISNTGDIALKSSQDISSLGTISTDNGSLEMSGKTFHNYLNVNLNDVGPLGITLKDSSQLINYGEIKIDNRALGIYIEDTLSSLINYENLIIVDGNIGIHVSGTMTNNDSISILNVSETGILSFGTLLNSINASIDIVGSGIQGIRFYNSPTSFNNFGRLSIANSSFYAIRSTRDISNHGILTTDDGKIEMSACTFYNHNKVSLINSQPAIAFRNSGQLNNFGEFIVADCYEGLLLEDSLSTITNNGVIEIKQGNTGIISYGTVINNDSLYIHDLSADGLIIRDKGELQNTLNASITVHDVGRGINTFKANLKKPLVENLGLINIYDCVGKGIQLEGPLINHNQITITETGFEALESKEDSLVNNGTIIINSSSSFGFRSRCKLIQNGILDITVSSLTENAMFVSDSVLNLGTINLNSSATNSTSALRCSPVPASDSLFFHNDGEININTVGNGVTLFKTTFLNDGTLELSDTPGFSIRKGLILGNEATFVNNDTLIILNKGLSISESNSGSAFFTNNGYIKLEGNEIGIAGFGEFLNSAGAKIESAKVVRLELKNNSIFTNEHCNQLPLINLKVESDAQLLNDGIMLIVKEESIEGSVINNGVIKTNANAFFVNPLLNNQSRIYSDIYGSLSQGIKEPSIIQKGNSPSYSISSNFWTDKAKTTIAGTYSEADQSFTPNAASLTADTLYFEAAHSSSCSFILPIAITSDTCKLDNQAEFTFTGTNSNNWHDPGNWDSGEVPCNCNNVTIPSGKQVEVEIGTKARARGMEAENGAVLTIPEGAVADFSLDYILEEEDYEEI